MTTRIKHFSALVAATALLAISSASFAAPKAAEHEDAPVTFGNDVAKPKIGGKAAKTPASAKAKPATKSKATPTGKPAKKVRSTAGK